MPTELYEFGEERGAEPRLVSKEFTLSLNEKANLRKFLKAWRGKDFTPEELEGFDISNLIGAPGVATITHHKSANGNTYLEIANVSKLMKGQECPPAISEPIVFGYDPFDPTLLEKLPDFITEKIMTSQEYTALMDPKEEVKASEPTPRAEDEKIPGVDDKKPAKKAVTKPEPTPEPAPAEDDPF